MIPLAKKLILSVMCLSFLVLPVDAKAAHTSKATPSAPPPLAQLIPNFPPLFTTYDVYVGGIHLVAAQIWFEEEGSKYHAVVKAKTAGFIGKFFPWNTVLDAHGSIEGDHFKPQEFFTRDDWDHKPKITQLHFDAQGNVVAEFNPPNHDENREIVTLEQTRGSLDPVTALLQMLAHVAVEKSCALPVPIFDGKRRFDITGNDHGFEDEGSADDYSVYSGRARVCGADFTMIAGEWKDREHAHFWQKSATESGRDPFRIYLASVGPDLPEIPVRLESESIAGIVVIHLSSWRLATDDEIKAQTPLVTDNLEDGPPLKNKNP